MWDTKTIYISQTEQRTFRQGEVFTIYTGQKAEKAQIVSFEGGIFHIRYRAGGEVYPMLGAVLAKALKPWRIPTEQLNRGY